MLHRPAWSLRLLRIGVVAVAVGLTVLGCSRSETSDETAPPPSTLGIEKVEFAAEDPPRAATPSGGEWRSPGLFSVSAAPPSSYCSDAVVAIHPAGDYEAPTPFLTTEDPDDPDRCNGVPVQIRFEQLADGVTIRFWGANRPYRLTAFDERGKVIDVTEQSAVPYNYRNLYSVSVTGDGRIARVVFGYEKALTMIHSVEVSTAYLSSSAL